MKNASTRFINAISNNAPIYAYAKFVLADGEELTLTSHDDFFVDGNSFTESGGSGFPFGSAVCKTININIDNHDDRYSTYDFYKAKITLYTEIEFDDGITERIQEGVFTVIDSVTPGDLIEFTAYDDMYKSDISFTSNLIYPTTCMLLLQEICSTCDISLGSASFKNSNFEIKKAPSGSTARDLIGYIAQISGGNAVISPTKTLMIKSYNLSDYNSAGIILGGKITDNLNNIISGGELSDNIEDSINSDNYTIGANCHVLDSFSTDPEIGTDDITITGIVAEKSENNETVKYLYGTEDYALKISNPLIEGNEGQAVALIGISIVGYTVRSFSGSFAPNPLIEFMDTAIIVDRKGNSYQSVIGEHTFNYLGASDVGNSIKSPERNRASYSNNATALYQKAQDLANQNRSEWEKAVERLTDTMNNASGLYSTQEAQSDGSTIYYFHDKPTLQESMVIIKMTAQALGISTDGGKTYPTGITVDGEAVIKILQTIGVNADWIRAGTLTLGGEGNERGTLSVLDGNNMQIGSWDKDGINISQGKFKNVSGSSYLEIGSSKLFLGHEGKNIGAIGLNSWGNEEWGMVFDLDPDGAYIGWASKSSHDDDFYFLKLYYSKPEESIKVGAELNLNGHTVSNGMLDGLLSLNATFMDNFTIVNGSNVNIYSNVDMHDYNLFNVKLSDVELSNVKISNITQIGDYSTFSGAVNFEDKSLHFQNGLLTHVFEYEK